jgi:hypothetical protein
VGFYGHGTGYAKREGVASGAAAIILTRSPEGFDREVRFTDGLGAPQPSPDGIYGLKIESDPQGFVTKFTAIDTEGEPMLLRRLGFAERQAVYDGKHRLAEIRYFDTEGRTAMGTAGYVAQRFTWNAAGNLTSQAYLDDRDRLVFVALFGFAKATYGYDDRQRLTEITLYRPPDKLVFFKNAVTRHTRRYDDRGNVIEEAFFDAANRPVIDYWAGYARTTTRCDPSDRVTERAFFGADGEPLVVPYFGGARVTYRYDDHGRLIEETHYGADGKLHATGPEAGAHFAFQYDAQGRRRRGTLFVPTREGVITETEHDIILQSYDDAGQTIEERRTDRAGRPALGPRGYSIARIARTEDGRREEWSFFGIDDQPVVDLDGAHRAIYTRDDQGILHGPRRLNLAGAPAAVATGFADAIDTQITRDERGNTTELVFVDSRGRPVIFPSRGFAKMTRRFDSHGNQVDATYFGVNGEWIMPTGAEGARIATTYDARGVKLESTSYVPTADGKLSEQEHLRLLRRFDEGGTEILEETYFDSQGRPIVGPDGWHRVSYEYAVASIRKSASFFGTDNRPTVGKIGYARFENVFDPEGPLVDARFFDAAGAAVVVPALVTQVGPNSAAEKAGLKAGDVLLTYAGHEIHNFTHWRHLIAQPLGAERELRVRRGVEVVVLHVPAGQLGFYAVANTESPPSVRMP